jgi:hypothetical protein
MRILRSRRFPVSPKSRTLAVLLALVLAPLLTASPVVGSPGALADQVSTERLLESVTWLADDAREGRRTGEPGAEAAAAWIAERFAELGLEPLGDDGTYLQRFDATVGVRIGEANRLEISSLDPLAVGTDFLPFGFSENGLVADAGLVFAGYGIHAPDLGYDDYADLDVAGKVVLVLRHEPQQDDPDSPFSGTENSRYSFFRTKAEAAKEQGAVAMLLVNGPLSPDYDGDALISLSREQGIGGGGLPALHVRKDVVNALFEAAGRDLEAWANRVDETLEPESFVFDDVSVTVETEVSKDRRPTDNVIAGFAGTDPHAGTVVVGAHYDHLGHGGEGSLAPESNEIHNGADDNASGTAAVLELARVLTEHGPLRRDVVFVAFSGEELGLLGSAHLAGNFPSPLEYVQAMINLDMVGRPTRNTVTVGGAGTSPAFGELIDRLDEGSPLDVSRDASGFGASDHTSFYAKDVPVLFFFSGLHEDYHRPSDDTENLDPEGFTEVVRMVSRALVELGDAEDKVEFARAAEDSLGAHGSGTGGGGGYGPYFGSIPEFGDREEPGVALSGVRSGSPAEEAGVQGGDVVIRFGGRDIADLYAYTAALRAFAPGDTVEVVVQREGEEVVLSAVLGRRE